MVYLDNAAGMPPDPQCAAWMSGIVGELIANPESAHAAGRHTAKLLANAGDRLLELLAPEWRGGRAVFAASGSDAFNLLSSAADWGPGRAVYSGFEHPALQAAACRSGGRLAAGTHVQSELGLLCPPVSGEVVLCDTIQSAGKLPLPPGADILAVSGHKLGAPGGAALLVNPACRLKFDFDSPRRRDYRFGRPEPVQILLMLNAVEQAVCGRASAFDTVVSLNKFIRSNLPKGVAATLEIEQTSPYILHLRMLGKQGAVVARMLSARGVMVSSSSACRAEAGGPSAAMRELGFRDAEAYEGLRVSFSPRNTRNDAEIFLRELERALADY